MTGKVGKADKQQESLADRSTGTEEEDGEPIRVVDKRRFANIDQEETQDPELIEDKPRFPSFVEELQSRLKQAEEQAERLQTRFKQAQADLEREAAELRTRLQRNADAKLETAKGEILKRFIDVADNLERAIIAAETSGESSKLLEGVKATHALLMRQLDAEGIKPIASLGEAFDPTLHEAIDTVEVEPERDGKVVEVYKAGYVFGERLLQPAVVRVGRARATIGED
jgi:molecular chaperone GrpE